MKKRMKNLTASAVMVIFIAGLSSAAAMAQDEKKQKAVELGAITVTAQKQEENIQKVPISISVMTDVDIEDRKIESIGDIADFVPNLMIYSHGYAGTNAPSMRGIVAPAETFMVTSGVYLDGIPDLSGVGLEDAMLDIERIEVLRGPQGTLYGKGTEAGAINIITRQPDNDFRGKVSLQLGEDEKRQVALSVTGPAVKDKLYFGLSGLYYSKDGFIKNTATGDMINDKQHWYGKGQVRWTPTDNLDISLAVSHLEYDEGEPDKTLGEVGAQMFGLSSPQNRRVASNLNGWDKSSKDNQSLKAVYDFSDALRLTSITTHRRYNQYYATDIDASSKTLMETDPMDSTYDTITQELRLNYTKGQWKGLIGLYYDNDNQDIFYHLDYGIGGTQNVNREFDGETYAIFTNITCDLTKKISVIVGLRYEAEQKDFTDNIMKIAMDDSWKQFTPKIALEYTPRENITTYISASKGYRPGGFNVNALSKPQYFTYDSETLWSYEAGIKTAFWENKLIINGAVYYMDIKDMQVTEQASAVEAYLTNAATATGKGVELEVMALLWDGLTLNASFGYNNTEFEDFRDIGGDYAGNKNPFVPQYTYNIGGQYRHDSGVYARADLIGVGKMYFDKANNYSRDAYEVVNMKIGYEADSYDMYLYAKNIFDREYNSYGYYGGFQTIYSQPREIGIQLTYRF